MLKRITSLSLLAGFLLSCEKDIEVTIPEEEPRLVMTSFLTPFDSVTAEVGESRFVLDQTEPGPISNATVTLFKDGSKVGSLSGNGFGLYESDFVMEPGALYRLEAETAEHGKVWAETTVPDSTAIDNVTSEIKGAFEEQLRQFKLTFTDDGATEDFYNLQVYILNRQYEYDPFTGMPVDSIDYFERVYIEAPNEPAIEQEYWLGEFGPVFNDDLFDGNTYTLQFSVYENRYYDTFTGEYIIYAGIDDAYYITFNSTDENYFRYASTLGNYYNNEGNPFAEPVQVHSNVTGGLGTFAGFSSSVYRYELK